MGSNSLVAATTGHTNTAVGYAAGSAITTGHENVAIGGNALDALTTGNDHVAVGYGALGALTTGARCTGLGYAAAANLSTGDDNTCVGYDSGVQITGGSDNTCVGNYAGDAITTGNGNVCLGYNSGTAITTSINNIMIGISAGSNHTGTSDGRNICIGDNTTLAAADDDRSIVIGHNTTGKGDNQTLIRGNDGIYNSQNTTAWNTTSDERIKKNIVDNNAGLDILNQIQVRNFEYRTEEEIVDFANPASAVVKNSGLHIGVIAQEIEKVLPEVVTESSLGIKSVATDPIMWAMVNAIKELSAKVEELESKLNN